MKKTRFMACLLLSVFIFSACSSNIENNAGEAQNGPTQSGVSNQFKPSGDLTFVSPMKLSDGNQSEDAFYQIIPRAENASNNIYYTDFSSKIKTVLCSRPEV